MLCSHFTVAVRREGPERGPGGNIQHTATHGPLQPVTRLRNIFIIQLMGSTKGYVHSKCDKLTEHCG
jgi:proteasome assembly chaperone (PAC2) family protein